MADKSSSKRPREFGGALAAGALIAEKYRIEGLLASGGMGAVFLASDAALDRKVALKVLLPEHRTDEECIARLMREAKVTARLQSEHALRVYEMGQHDEVGPYVVLELLDGVDLVNLLKRDGPVALEQAILLILQACEVIAEAHERRIVHRDIKPANLFLTSFPSGAPKLKVLDFGVSSDLTTRDGLSLTRADTILGSPYYMSPEQFRSAKDVDERTDIWSLGTVLYELTTGVLPVEGDSLAELSVKVLTHDVPPPSVHMPALPPAFDAVIARALSRAVGERYASAKEFADALLELLPLEVGRESLRVGAGVGEERQDPASSSVPTPSVTAPSVSEATPARRRWLMPLLAATAATSVFALAAAASALLSAAEPKGAERMNEKDSAGVETTTPSPDAPSALEPLATGAVSTEAPQPSAVEVSPPVEATTSVTLSPEQVPPAEVAPPSETATTAAAPEASAKAESLPSTQVQSPPTTPSPYDDDSSRVSAAELAKRWAER